MTLDPSRVSIPNSPLEMTLGKNINTCFRATHPRRDLGIPSSIRSVLSSTGCRSNAGILRRYENSKLLNKLPHGTVAKESQEMEMILYEMKIPSKTVRGIR